MRGFSALSSVTARARSSNDDPPPGSPGSEGPAPEARSTAAPGPTVVDEAGLVLAAALRIVDGIGLVLAAALGVAVDDEGELVFGAAVELLSPDPFGMTAPPSLIETVADHSSSSTTSTSSTSSEPDDAPGLDCDGAEGVPAAEDDELVLDEEEELVLCGALELIEAEGPALRDELELLETEGIPLRDELELLEAEGIPLRDPLDGEGAREELAPPSPIAAPTVAEIENSSDS